MTITEENFEKIKAKLKLDAQGYLPTIIQDQKTQKVLTLCYLNVAALKKTLEEGYVYVFRRSQNKLMKKGEVSGHVQELKEFRIDCEGKSAVFLIDQKVAGCHAGYFTCYYRRVDNLGNETITEPIIFDPKKVY